MKLTDADRLKWALIDLKSIEKNKTLLNGHFTMLAKKHVVKVKELKSLYLTAKNI